MSDLKRIIKVTDGPLLENEADVDAFLAELRNKPKRDVKALVQGMEFSPDMLQTYNLRLLGVLEIPEVVVRDEVFDNPLFEDPDVVFDMDGSSKQDLRPMWHNYHFLLPIAEGEPVIIEAQMVAMHGDWISGWRDWLPLVDMMMKGDKHEHERKQLEQRRAELYEDLKGQVVQRLEDFRDK
jgi:hypothetical protein